MLTGLAVRSAGAARMIRKRQGVHEPMTDHPPPPPEAPHRPYVDDDSLRADLRRVTVLANDRAQEVARLRRENDRLRRDLAAERGAHTHMAREWLNQSTGRRKWWWK